MRQLFSKCLVFNTFLISPKRSFCLVCFSLFSVYTNHIHHGWYSIHPRSLSRSNSFTVTSVCCEHILFSLYTYLTINHTLCKIRHLLHITFLFCYLIHLLIAYSYFYVTYFTLPGINARHLPSKHFHWKKIKTLLKIKTLKIRTAITHMVMPSLLLFIELLDAIKIWKSSPWNLYNPPRWSSRVSSDLDTGSNSKNLWITISNTGRNRRHTFPK